MSERRLFHFSDNGSIERFDPRPVDVPSPRKAGEEWLNGPLVWAVDDAHEFPYLFPRDVARIVLWAVDTTTVADRATWLGEFAAVAYVEQSGYDATATATIYRYEMPNDTFVTTSDDWMWVSRESVVPSSVDPVSDLPRHLSARGVDLRRCPDMSQMRGAWNSTVHASGIRLRYATTWTER